MYIGRFAPSPTGPLHFGSLVAAVASYCEAKTNQGKWLLRIEDLDKPREAKGAANTILRQLEAYGFEWDDNVLYQSQRSNYYADVLATLSNSDLIYPCTCTRKEIADSSNNIGIEGVIYPGTCLNQPIKVNVPQAWRIKTSLQTISFNDAIQGKISQNIRQDIGDFILKRADCLFAYQLAVVVDDAAQGITHIVRGADLLDSTPRQIYLQQILNYPQPSYAHVPVVCNEAGEKLSKQTLASPLDTSKTEINLIQALNFLGQAVPKNLANEDKNTIWLWAYDNWQLSKISKTKSLQLVSA
jgi:glutamyl-Q tRNA(Asp) synthetase